ncbi:MAG: rod shape-determining protein RodA [Fimbriimonadia bacterium]|jgi:rod shape determining protein RodA
MVTDTSYRRMLKRVDWYLVLTTILLTIAGITAVYSAVLAEGSTVFKKHLLWVAIGMMGAVVFALVPPRFWVTHWRKLYVLAIAMLAVVLFAGVHIGGAQRWMEIGPLQFQPSELAKLLLIITLARLLAYRSSHSGALATFWLSLLHIAVPAALVFKQPDLGTALVFVGIWFGMCFIAGLPLKMLGLWLAAVAALFGIAWEQGIIRDYQKDRVVAFLDPTADPRGAGYQVLQARLAVGSGQLAGKGYLQGRQKEGAWIPVQETDFIFTVVGEEGGFMGSAILLGAYGLLMYRLWRAMIAASPALYRLIVAGVLSMWAYHVIVNVAMVIGLFPVVGVPLPLVSYGGTSTLVAFCSLGLVAGIRGREEEIVF